MNFSKSFSFFVCAAALMGAAACGDDDGDDGDANNGGTAGTAGTGGSAGQAGSGGTAGTAGSGGSGGTAGADGGMQMAQIRVAHLSPNAPPVDVCVGSGGTFTGPVLKSLGDTDGLAYSEVTSYVELGAGTYNVRIVAPNAADCTTPLAGLPDVTGVALSAGNDFTAAAIGMLNASGSDEAFAVALFEDENTPADASKGYVRFIHASPDTPNVDVGTGSGGSFSAVWSNVAFSEVGQVGGRDYLETDPLTDATISARATETTADALVIPGVDLPAGAVATAFAIGNLDGSPAPLKVLLCVDNAATSTCSVVP